MTNKLNFQNLKSWKFGISFFISNHFSLNIAVFFIRELDDREALALATRICCHPSVSIILIKVDPIREEDEEQNEKVSR